MNTSDVHSKESVAWLSKHMLPRLAKWMQESETGVFKHSLSLIAVDEYASLYQKLKQKYGKNLVKASMHHMYNPLHIQTSLYSFLV